MKIFSHQVNFSVKVLIKNFLLKENFTVTYKLVPWKVKAEKRIGNGGSATTSTCARDLFDTNEIKIPKEVSILNAGKIEWEKL